MQHERTILYVLVLGSIGLNISNFWKIDSITRRLPPNYGTWDVVCKNRDNFIHKLFAKEPLRKYAYVLNRAEHKGNVKNPYPNKVWIYWSEGFDKAPKITPACIESIKEHIPNMEIVLLDKNNFDKYIKLPKHILKKYKEGVIGETQFSDILRCFLLRDYGGLWIDATTYISDNLPEDMLSADFFAPSIIDINPERSPDFKFNNFVIHGAFASYFMYSKKPHNYIFDCMAAFFEEYWKDKSWYDYYLIYEFSAVAMEEDKRFFDEILNMLRHHYYPEEQFLQLSKMVTQKFDLAKWTKIKKFPIHKICGAVKLTGELKKGSFAEKLANGELN